MSQSDAAFADFRKRLATYLNMALPAAGSSLPSPQGVKFHPYNIVSLSCIIYGDIFLIQCPTTVHQITEYRLISVDYESTEDWRLTTDLLRCSPCFFKRPRYDCVVAKTITGPIFARLIFLFTCEVDSISYPVALIQPFDAYTGPARNKDRDLGLYRVRAKPRSQAEFIPAQSIIRGAYVVPTYERPDDYFVSDMIDSDWFLRLMQLTK